MIAERMLRLLILEKIHHDIAESKTYNDFIKEYYDYNKMKEEYHILGEEFLQEYALNKTEKSE